MYRAAVIVCVVLVICLVLGLVMRRRAPGGGGGGGGAVIVEREKGEGTLVSIVLLVREPPTMDEAHVRVAAERAFSTPFGDEPGDGDFVRRFEDNMFPVGYGDAKLAVITAPNRYVATQAFLAPIDVADATAGRRAEDAFAAHDAWLSVDWFGDAPPEAGPRIYGLLGQLAAELAGDDCVAVYGTESRRLVAFDDRIRERLRDDPWRLLGPDRLVRAESDDPQIAAAVAEAKRRWPEFVSAWAHRTPAGRFDIKASFSDYTGGPAELMWVGVQSIDGDVVRGMLKNQPHHLTTIKSGDPIDVPTESVIDFLYSDQGQTVGGFTDRVLLERMNRHQR